MADYALEDHTSNQASDFLDHDESYISLPSINEPSRRSLSPSTSPTPAIGACPDLSRCVSTASSVVSNSSDHSSSTGRDSLGSVPSRDSLGSTYTSRQSIGGVEPGRPKRRGYVRPQGTNFAASAQSRESVMSLGSIAHLQYYFARTGLLDGKGGRLAKRKNAPGVLDLSALTPPDRDSYRLSMAIGSGVVLPDSPTEAYSDEYYEEYEGDPDMLPPTVSTYNYRSKPLPRPPTLHELKSELQSSLTAAAKVLSDAQAILAETQTPSSPHHPVPSTLPTPDSSPVTSAKEQNQGWYELQGMHILDILTLAIRAAKIYYTAHDQPQRLAIIKSERKIRSELLSVMDVLKRMATRTFAGGLREEERVVMDDWVVGVWAMLRREEEMEAEEQKERKGWTWLDDSKWDHPVGGECISREYAFLASMDPDSATLSPYEASIFTSSTSTAPTKVSPLLLSLRNGVRLINLHNAIVKKSKRPFGSIPTYHTDTAKPYRCAENLRYWIKAAELRWEVVLKIDVMSIVNGAVVEDGSLVCESLEKEGKMGTGEIAKEIEAWRGFESMLWKWCRAVREEISTDLR